MLQIRRAEPSDQDSVIKLWEGVGLGKAEADELRAITIGPSAILLVAEDEGVLVGAAVAAYDGWRAYIYHVAVASSQQRQGIASILMADAERQVYERGARRVYVMVNEDNLSGLALASATGYEPNRDLVLVKQLASP